MRIAIAFLTLASLALAQDKGRPPQGNGVDAGKEAVDFKLKRLKSDPKEKDEEVQLSSFKDKKPVLLVFGSYT